MPGEGNSAHFKKAQMKSLVLTLMATIFALFAIVGSIEPALAGSDETCLLRDCSAG